jgi:hypothetical protein
VALIVHQVEIEDFLTGKPVSGASVTVYLAGTTTRASLVNIAGSSISNPMTSDSNSLVAFKADSAYTYEIVWSSGNRVSPRILLTGGFTEDVYGQFLSLVTNGFATETAARTAADTAEVTARMAADIAETAARIAADAAETATRTAADAAETAARLAADAAETALRLAKDALLEGIAVNAKGRPGDNPGLFTHVLTGNSIAAAPLDPSLAIASPSGVIYRVTGASVIAAREPVAYDPSRVFAIRCVYARFANPVTPSNVYVAVRWLDQNFATIGTDTTISARTGLSIEGPRTVVAQVRAVSGVTPPAGCVYFRVYFQTVGSDGVTDLMEIRTQDITDSGLYSPDLTAIGGRVTSLEVEVATLSPLAAGVANGLATLDSLAHVPLSQVPPLPVMYGAVGNGTTNDSAAFTAMLTAGKLVFDGGGKTYGIASSLVLPADAALSNITFKLLTPGMNGVLFNHRNWARNVKVIGTNTIGTVRGTPFYERGYYSGVDSMTGCDLEVAVENCTIGFQMQPYGGGYTNAPHHNRIVLHARNIPGQDQTQGEGYGFLGGPYVDNHITVHATNIKRHALYLADGCSRNYCVAHVDTCFNDAVVVYTDYNETDPLQVCQENEIHAFVLNCQNDATALAENTHLARAMFIGGHCERNKVWIYAKSNGAGNTGTDAAIAIEGNQTALVGGVPGAFPKDNQIHVAAEGIFRNAFVASSYDSDNTIFVEPTIHGRGSSGVILFSDTGGNTYTPTRAGAVHGGTLDGLDSSGTGVGISSARGMVDVSGGILFRNFPSAYRVRDNAGGKRLGRSRTWISAVTATSAIADGSSADVTFTYPETYENAVVTVHVQSVSSTRPGVQAIVYTASDTAATITVFNNSTVSQTVSVYIEVSGD